MKKFEPNMNILKDWLEGNSKLGDKQKFINNFESINKIILDRLGEDYQIGHSYFMENNLDKEKVKRIIDYDIKPLVEQYFFAKKDEQLLKDIKDIYLSEMLKAAVPSGASQSVNIGP